MGMGARSESDQARTDDAGERSRGLRALLLSIVTAAVANLVYFVVGWFLVPLLLIVGLVRSFARAPSHWIWYGAALAPGLLPGIYGLMGGPEGMSIPLSWLSVAVGIVGCAILDYGYTRIVRKPEAPVGLPVQGGRVEDIVP